MPFGFFERTGEFFDTHNGSFSALSGIAVAVFTYFLLQVTRRLHIVGEQQATIASRQTDILQKQLAVYSPRLGIDTPKYEIRIKPDDDNLMDAVNMSIVWKNFGQSIATQVNYWISDLIIVPYEITGFDKGAASHFVKTIFRTDNSPGAVFINPSDTIATDQVVITVAQLKDLFEKRIRVSFWTVARYGSQFHSLNWFAETAIFCELVLDVEPVLLAKKTRISPFRMAVLANRYRESYDS